MSNFTEYVFLLSLGLAPWEEQQIPENERNVIAEGEAVPAEEEIPEMPENAHAERESQLESREKALAEWEAQLESREKALEEREAQLESLRHAPATEQPVQEDPALAIQQKMAELIKSYSAFHKQTGAELRTLSSMVTKWNEEGFRALCKLSRHMHKCREEALRPWVTELDQILERDFPVEVIEPRAGDPYDSALHTRLDYCRTGRKVTNCLIKGWKHGNITLEHAVVETD